MSELTPPVAMILTKSAPPLICSRAALRQSSGPSHSRPVLQPWPPVMHRHCLAIWMFGPSNRPSFSAFFRSTSASLRPFISLTNVTPERRCCWRWRSPLSSTRMPRIYAVFNVFSSTAVVCKPARKLEVCFHLLPFIYSIMSCIMTKEFILVSGSLSDTRVSACMKRSIL